MSGKPQAIPLFADAYLADTMHLTTEEHGAYLLLLMAAWRAEDCSLPNDDRKLARITGLSPRKWKTIKPTLIEFWPTEGERIFNARLRKERSYVQRRVHANSENARKRWNAQDVENKQSGSCDGISDGISDGNAPPPPPHSGTLEANASNAQNEPVFDPVQFIFDSGHRILQHYEPDDKKRGALIGAWRKDAGSDALLIDALTAAVRERPQHPVAWMRKAIQVRKDNPHNDRRHKSARDNRDGFTRALHREAGLG